MFIDTHCHLSYEYYDDIDKVISDNREALIDKIIISGCDKKGIKEALNFSKLYDEVYVSIGYHPDEVLNIEANEINELEQLIKNEDIVAIGEIGLDYHYTKDYREKQLWLFEKQLEIAEKLNMPVVIHSRDAVEDTINILKKYKVSGVIHCFSGSLEIAQIYIKMGFKLGIGGVVTFKNSKLGDIVRNVGVENIVLETDSPYLAPVPYRGSLNSSKNIPIIAKEVSRLCNISIEEVAKITSNNAWQVLNLDKFM